MKTAPALFQHIMDNVSAGLKGTAAYSDDIIVVGRKEKELKDQIECLLQRNTHYGFHPRPEKCDFFLESIKYLGFNFNLEGRHLDPGRIRAIVNMPSPTDVQTLRSFPGF